MAMKKAQIKITENIMIIFILFILLVFGMIFYVRIYQSNLEKKMERLAGEEAIDIALKVNYFPEAICSESVDIKADCFDIIKLETAKSVISNNMGDYYDLLKFSEIKVTQVFPSTGQEWVLYDNKGDNEEKMPPAFIPISIHDPISDEYYFGVLEVAVWV